MSRIGSRDGTFKYRRRVVGSPDLPLGRFRRGGPHGMARVLDVQLAMLAC